MRLSFGGSDELGLAIARRLAGSEYLAYTVEARGAGGGIPVMVRPNGRPKFRGPVVVLTGPITMSAAETFVMSLMGRTPRVTRTGESTQGLFCDVLEGRLPNGWRFGLPNAVYRSAGGEAFDARGIPPDFEAPVYADGDVAAGIDPGMAKALDVLRGRLVVPILPTAADIGRPPSGSR